MNRSLTDAQRLKFRLLESGLTISRSASARLREATHGGAITPADYASTSGIILLLEDGVWVNCPIIDFNPNFVEDSAFVLTLSGNDLLVHGAGLSSTAQFWVPPKYHGEAGWNRFVFTHGDRVRLAPIQGCAMACKFCNIPFEDAYGTKPIDKMIAAVEVALYDPVQPARHVLISGGTPRASDAPYLREVYRRVLKAFSGVDVDIMMVPDANLMDLKELADNGVNELSINIEIYNQEIARTYMPHKFRQGLTTYLDFIEQASTILGPGRVRSMLMVGLEPEADTLLGVQAILDRGGIPVLSPFRPDPATPLSGRGPSTAEEMESVFAGAETLARSAGTSLGPTCLPCTHNTLTLADAGNDCVSRYVHQIPVLV